MLQLCLRPDEATETIYGLLYIRSGREEGCHELSESVCADYSSYMSLSVGWRGRARESKVSQATEVPGGFVLAADIRMCKAHATVLRTASYFVRGQWKYHRAFAGAAAVRRARALHPWQDLVRAKARRSSIPRHLLCDTGGREQMRG